MIGPNGAGKSTLLKCITNLLKPHLGVVLIEQQNVLTLNDVEAAKLRSVVLADRIYPFNMTTMEIIMLGRHPHQTLLRNHTKKDNQVISNCIDLLEISDLVDRKFYQLSDGQKQKVLIARALCQEPKVLVLDEPSTHLDASSRIEILLKLRQIAKSQNVTVIASMHEVEIAYRVSDKILVLDEGKLKKYDSPQMIFGTNIVSEMYSNKKISWDPTFGSFELKINQDVKPKIHVVGGHGTGAQVYRLLARLGQNFSTGVLDRIDVDYHLANTIGARVFVKEEIDEYISFDKRSVDDLDSISIIIDTAFPINKHTRQNIDFIKKIAGKNNALIFSFRMSHEALVIYGNDFDVKCGNFEDLEKLCLKK